MSLLNKLFGKRFEQRTIDHPFLGSVSNDKHGCWNGTRVFPVINAPIAFSINSTELTDEAVNVLRRIEEHFPTVYASLESRMFEGVDPFDDGVSMDEFFRRLDFKQIAITDVGSEEWELSADTMLDGFTIRIQMNGLEFQSFEMDT